VAGLAEIVSVRLGFPAGVTPDPAFETLAVCGLIALDHGGAAPTMEIELSRADGGARACLRLPEFSLI
jgi:hypothetical protein